MLYPAKGQAAVCDSGPKFKEELVDAEVNSVTKDLTFELSAARSGMASLWQAAADWKTDRGRPADWGRCLAARLIRLDRKSTRLNSSHSQISYAVFCLKKKKTSSST